jgi:hypothetical protein
MRKTAARVAPEAGPESLAADFNHASQGPTVAAAAALEMTISGNCGVGSKKSVLNCVQQEANTLEFEGDCARLKQPFQLLFRLSGEFLVLNLAYFGFIVNACNLHA